MISAIIRGKEASTVGDAVWCCLWCCLWMRSALFCNFFTQDTHLVPGELRQTRYIRRRCIRSRCIRSTCISKRSLSNHLVYLSPHDLDNELWCLMFACFVPRFPSRPVHSHASLVVDDDRKDTRKDFSSNRYVKRKSNWVKASPVKTLSTRRSPGRILFTAFLFSHPSFFISSLFLLPFYLCSSQILTFQSASFVCVN